MSKIILKVMRLFSGLFLYALGIVMAINANLGLLPWGVFHQGISKVTHITIGQATIIVGIIVVIIASYLGEKPGVGTLCNMIFIGIFMDALVANKVVPICYHYILRFSLMISSMIIISLATYLYLSVGLGAGPRDGLMTAITKKTQKSVRAVRSLIEIVPLTLGAMMGGNVGIGTIIMAFSMGPIVQFVFKLLKFDIKKVSHKFIGDKI